MSLLQFTTYGLLMTAAGIVSLSVGLLVLTRDWRSNLHRSFFLITGFGAVWLFSFAMTQFVRQTGDAYICMAIDYGLAVPFIAPSVYLFSVYWRGKNAGPMARVGFVIAGWLGMLVLFWPRRIFYFVEIPVGRYNQFHGDMVGLGYFAFIMLFFLGYSSLAFQNFIAAWKEAESPGRKRQCLLFLLAACVGYSGSIDFLVAVGLKAYPFGYISFSGFALLIAYAIVRYRFLNVDVFMKKLSFIFLIYSLLTAAILPFAIPIINHLLSEANRPVLPFFALSIGVGVTLSLGPIIYTRLSRHNAWIRGHLGAGFTHELKTPLSAIQSAVEILQEKSANTDVPEYLRMIQINVKRLESFITDLLRIAQIQEGDLTIQKTLFDVQETLSTEIDAHQVTANIRSIKIRNTTIGPVLMEGDEDKLRQVFSNLLSNAVKFSNREGTIFVELRKSERDIRCTITDHGAGIPREILPKVFDRFFTGTNSSKGAGLGLTIAKAWIESHGGRIWAESEGVGKGTSIKFTLPR